MPLRSSYRAPAYPARALASAAAEHVPALDDELGERVLDRRARLLRPVKQRRRRSIQRYRFPCEHHDFEVADAAPGRCSRTEPGIPRAATQGASRCGRDVSPIAEARAESTARRFGALPTQSPSARRHCGCVLTLGGRCAQRARCRQSASALRGGPTIRATVAPRGARRVLVGDRSSARFVGRRRSSPPWDRHRRPARTTASIRALARRLQAAMRACGESQVRSRIGSDTSF